MKLKCKNPPLYFCETDNIIKDIAKPTYGKGE